MKIIKKLRGLLHRKNVPRLVYILLLILATVNVSTRGGAFSYVLFYVVLIYPVLALLYLLYSFIVLNIYQETEYKLVHKNVPIKYQLIIENTFIFPITGLSFYYDKNITHFQEDFMGRTFNLSGLEKLELSDDLTCGYAGAYDAGVEGFYLEDMFGLIRLKLKVKIPVRLHILPVITDVAHEDIKTMTDSRENGNMFNLSINEEQLGNDIRKYSPGDALNTIHWKNYARTGELYVRLQDKKESEMMCLVLDTLSIDSSLENLIMRDRFLEYLVSVAEYFGAGKKPLMIFYYNAGVQKCLIDGLDSFHEFYMNTLSAIGSNPAAGHKEDILKEIRGHYGNVVIFREEDCLLSRE